MDEATFERAAAATLARILDAVEASGADVDADLHEGVLMLAFADGRQIVINRHGPNRQVWLSSPLSGARHFDPHGDGWRDTRDGRMLTDVLAEDFSALAGVPATFA